MTKTAELKKPRGRPAAAKTVAQASPVKGLDRSLALLELLAGEDGLSLTDVAQRAGVAPSTAHRILTTLLQHKFVMQDDERDLWFIGVKAFQIGNAFLRNRKLVDAGRRTMRALMRSCGESVNLAIEDDRTIVYLMQVESHNPIRAFHRPGSRGMIHVSAVGKALLATYEDEAVEKLLHETGMAKFTERTIVNPKKLFKELGIIRKRGWAIDDEERMEGMRCVAAAIFNEYGEAVAGLSISGPVNRLSDERIGELGPMVKRAAYDITTSIGGLAPRPAPQAAART